MGVNHPLIHPLIQDGSKLEIPEKFISELYQKLFSLSGSRNNKKEGKKVYRHESISTYIEKYYDEKLDKEYPELFEELEGKKLGLGRSSVARAETGESGSNPTPIKYQLLDIMCSAAWTKPLSKIILQKKYVIEGYKYIVSIPDYAKKQIFDEIQRARYLEPSKTEISSEISSIEERSIFGSRNILHLSKPYWNNLKIKDERERLASVERFFTHTDSSKISLAVAQDGCIVSPSNLFLVTDRDGISEQKSIAQILDLAASQSFGLIKILSEGGVGKSTFLYWISKHHNESYIFFLLDRVNESVIYNLLEIIKEYPNPGNIPYAILIDNITAPEIRGHLEYLIKDVRDNVQIPVLFIFGERESRYNIYFESNRIDKLFGDNVQNVLYLPPSKIEIFEIIYSHLKRKNFTLDSDEIKQNCQEIFLNASINSISEGTFALIQELKLKNKIDYSFDWEDWDTFIEQNEKFHILRGLFTMVACFYQFGIKIPISLQSSFLNKADKKIIAEALAVFPSITNPITLEVGDQEFYLGLKHEFLASWYLRTEKGRALGELFISHFINDVKNEISARLFRKLRKAMKLEEYRNSFIFKLINPFSALKIIDHYLNTTISEEERSKMINEKGIIHLLIGDEALAISTFESNKGNNHSLDQLAKIYEKSPATYIKAIECYKKILTNEGYYAISPLKRLLSKAWQERITLNYEEFPEITTEILHQETYELLAEKQFDEAIDRLTQIKNPTLLTAKLYCYLAQSLPFTPDKIETKRSLYLKAIQLHRELSETENNYYIANYLVFLFRIDDAFERRNLNTDLKFRITKDQKNEIETLFYSKIKGLDKFYYRDIPNKDNLEELSTYLTGLKDKALQYINPAKSVFEVLRGSLILRSVIYHSIKLPKIRLNAAKLLAYCFAKNADRAWNNFSLKENRAIAENLYDELLFSELILSPTDMRHIFDNLFSYQELIKFQKITDTVTKLLRIPKYKNYPILYRMRGTACKLFENYTQAMSDFKYADRICIRSNFLLLHDFFVEKKSILYNITELICLSYEKKQPFKGENLSKASSYIRQIKKIPVRSDLTKLEMRVQSLRDSNNDI